LSRLFSRLPRRDSSKLLLVGVGVGELCANAGWLASSTFIPLYALEVGATMSEIGQLLASYYLVSTIMTTILGRVSDVRRLRKVVIVTGLAGSAAVYWFLGVSKNYLQLLFLWGLLLGIVDSAHKPASTAIIAEVPRRETVGRYIGILNAFTAAGMASGSIIAGKIADLLGLPFVFTASSFMLMIGAVSSFAVLKLNMRPLGSLAVSERKKESRSRFDSRYFLASGIFLLCIVVFLRNCGFWGVSPFLSVYLAQLGAKNTLIGTIVAANFFAQIFFMPIMGWVSDNARRTHVLSTGVFVTVLATFLLSVVRNPLEVFPIMVIVGFSWSSIVVASNTIASDLAPRGRLGETMGIVLTSMNLGGVAGPALAGMISEIYDLRMTFRSLALFPLLGFLFSVKSVRERTKDRKLSRPNSR
jgi:MFS family permease